ncbi:MAG: hypothetical protein GY722_24795, partial [bacterium]|nr:hypothetical protein [bacterium]
MTHVDIGSCFRDSHGAATSGGCVGVRRFGRVGKQINVAVLRHDRGAVFDIYFRLG